MDNTEGNTKSELAEFSSLMRSLIGKLIAQACEMTGIVYQCYCVEGRPTEEIANEFHVPEESIELIVQYYDRKKEEMSS